MAYVTWKFETLEKFCSDVFRAFGFSERDGNVISDVLLTADLYGIESHGMQRMVRYHKGIAKGQIHLDAKPEVVFETPVSAVIDGHSGMGQEYDLAPLVYRSRKIHKVYNTNLYIYLNRYHHCYPEFSFPRHRGSPFHRRALQSGCNGPRS